MSGQGEAMRTAIRVPPITSIRIVLTRWVAADGVRVRPDEEICEFEAISPYGSGTAESTLNLPSPSKGVLRHGIPAGSTVAIGQEVGWVESDG
jgi:hypothetical protein